MGRIEPRLPASALKTYEIRQPFKTHFRRATCVEVDCPDYINGWRVRVEGLSPADAHLARNCGRKYAEVSITAGETWLIFEAGQPCFRSERHFKSLERTQLFLVRDGDFRGNPRGTEPVHRRPEDWVDDFANHQQVLADRMEQG